MVLDHPESGITPTVSVKKGEVGPRVRVNVVATNFLYARIGFRVRVEVQAC